MSRIGRISIKKILNIIAYLVIIIGALFMLGHWFVNPELSQMEIFHKFWGLYVGVIVSAIILKINGFIDS